MAQYQKIARPYAEALFALAGTTDKADQWQQALRVLGAIAIDHAVEPLLRNPSVTPEQMQQLLIDVLKQADSEVVTSLGDALINFIAVVADARRVMALPDVAALYSAMLADYQRTKYFEVTSAYPLDESSKSNIEKALEKRFAAKASIEYKQDSSLLGGAIIRAGDWVLDGTLKTRLARLKEVITV